MNKQPCVFTDNGKISLSSVYSICQYLVCIHQPQTDHTEPQIGVTSSVDRTFIKIKDHTALWGCVIYLPAANIHSPNQWITQCSSAMWLFSFMNDRRCWASALYDTAWKYWSTIHKSERSISATEMCGVSAVRCMFRCVAGCAIPVNGSPALQNDHCCQSPEVPLIKQSPF